MCEQRQGDYLRQRIHDMGFTLKGFANRLSKKYDLFVISDVTLSRALHHLRGDRAERWIREKVAEELRYLEELEANLK